jgi:hypothetical protein
VRYCIYTTSNNLRSLSVRSITITPKACIACPANNSSLNGGILALEARKVSKGLHQALKNCQAEGVKN